jgi:hypothetical protein
MKDISVPPLVTPQVGGNLSDLPVRNGANPPHKVAFCTPSLKVKRNMVMRDFAPDIEALYAVPRH